MPSYSIIFCTIVYRLAMPTKKKIGQSSIEIIATDLDSHSTLIVNTQKNSRYIAPKI